MGQAVVGSRERDATEEEDGQDEVGEEGREVDNLEPDG